MEDVIQAGVFTDNLGNPLTTAIRAQVVEKETTAYAVDYPNQV